MTEVWAGASLPVAVLESPLPRPDRGQEESIQERDPIMRRGVPERHVALDAPLLLWELPEGARPDRPKCLDESSSPTESSR